MDFMRQNWMHPSVFIWSFGNQEISQNGMGYMRNIGKGKNFHTIACNNMLNLTHDILQPFDLNRLMQYVSITILIEIISILYINSSTTEFLKWNIPDDKLN